VKYLSWILTVPLAIVAVVFAISNRAAATLNLWPFGISVEAPLFILVLGSALVGLIAGGFIAWLSAGATRRRRRAAIHRAEAAERELAFLRRKIERERGAVSERPANDTRRGVQSGPNQLPAARA
jgi:uncharacterized integral membrane protein